MKDYNDSKNKIEDNEGYIENIHDVDIQSNMITLHWVPLIIAFLYAVSPINIIFRDIPYVDLFEDGLFIAFGILHGLQKNVFKSSKAQKILFLSKWILLGLGVVVIVVMNIIMMQTK